MTWDKVLLSAKALDKSLAQPAFCPLAQWAHSF